MAPSAPDLSSTSHSSGITDLVLNKTPHVSPVSGRTNVFSRLQALFPSSSLTGSSSPPADSSIQPSGRKETATPRFIKVRITTWNMHESLPKGDLAELLGKVTPVDPTTERHPPLTSMPSFPADGNHPYHLIIIAGQECPTQSGIPLGLGAGFKLIDKDKEKDKLQSQEKEAYQEPESTQPSASSGWTAILEDWYCYAGNAHLVDKKRGFRSMPSSPTFQERKGPYETLVKERMMGLYLAVYIHRDIRHLVRGTSKSAVTAGLIGGRVGNKGGVGISINLDGTTLLFINAHLAAHEGKVLHRLNDMQKIKTMLSVDDWLDQDDPRLMSEDLTDRFDHSFIFGDLNFRLDISRLHADWLISRKDYTQALAFDQLYNMMRTGRAFVGFREAPINFPPTFKYDVLRTIKRHKKKSRRSKETEDNGVTDAGEQEHEADEQGYGDSREGEVISTTSLSTRATTDHESEDDDSTRSKVPPTGAGNLLGKGLAAAAANKAKTKWKALISPNISKKKFRPSNHAPWSAESEGSVFTEFNVSKPVLSDSSANFNVVSTESLSVNQNMDRPRPVRGESLSYQPKSTPGINSTQAEEYTDEQDRGVYDTSSKQRVPSWCDRILWKSTVEPNESEDEIAQYSTLGPRTRVGNFFANAFRMRSRKLSHGSLTENTSSAQHHFTEVFTPSSSSELESVVPTETYRDTRESSQISQRPNSIDGIPRPISRARRRASIGLPVPRSKTIPGMTSPVSFSSPSSNESESAETSSPPLPKEFHHMPSMWRFLPFFHRNASQSALAHETLGTPENVLPAPRPRKGDVICLSYDSLDDRGMRRLEGRSDHRPVIGSYAIYA